MIAMPNEFQAGERVRSFLAQSEKINPGSFRTASGTRMGCAAILVAAVALAGCQTVEVGIPYNAYKISTDSSDGSVLFDHELLAASGVSAEAAVKQTQLCAARDAVRLGFKDVIFMGNPLVHKEGTWSPARYRVRLRTRYLKASANGGSGAQTMAESLSLESGFDCPR